MNTADELEEKSIGTGALTFADGHRETLHVHAGYGQLKWPRTGVTSVRTPDGIFVVGPAQAVWIPPGQLHGGMYSGEVLEQSLYVHERHCHRLPRRCCPIDVSPRLAAAVVETVASRSGYRSGSPTEDEALLALLCREMVVVERRPVALSLPEASELQPLFDSLLRAPQGEQTLAAWAQKLGKAERSLRRELVKQTGIPFSEWRKRARALYALRRLCVGCDVGTIAAELGYDSKSAFVYMFRTTLGVPPGRYYRGATAGPRQHPQTKGAARVE